MTARLTRQESRFIQIFDKKKKLSFCVCLAFILGVYLFKGEEEQNETPFKNKMNHPSKMKGTMNLIALPLALLLRRVILLFIQSYMPMLRRHYTNQFTLIIIINHKRTRHKSTKNLCNMLIIYAYNCHFLMTQLDLCNMQQKSPPTIQQP